MKGGDNGSYYVLKMLNWGKNYVQQVIGDVHLQKLNMGLYVEGHRTDMGHSLDGVCD